MLVEKFSLLGQNIVNPFPSTVTYLCQVNTLNMRTSGHVSLLIASGEMATPYSTNKFPHYPWFFLSPIFCYIRHLM